MRFRIVHGVRRHGGWAVFSAVVIGVAISGCLSQRRGFRAERFNGAGSSTPSETSALLARAKKAVEEQLALTVEPAPVGPARADAVSIDDVVRHVPKDPDEVGLKDIARPKQVKLSLRDAVSRGAANNFQIRTEGYGPAISATDILQAEAAFDAVYFLEAQYDKINQPSPSELISSDSDSRTLTTGITKLMSTGATVTGTYNLNRFDTSLSFATLNPSFTSNFVVELRQPLLKGFGVDVNRSGIDAAKNSLRIAKYKHRRTVRDVLAEIEKTYWQLVQARRDVVIQHDLVKQTEEMYQYLWRRRDFDVYRALISRAEALLETRKAEYVQIKNRVKDLEDQLKSLLNDPQLNQGEEIEIIPTDFPMIGPVVVDRIGEVQAALENRSELEESKLAIENARINVAVMKNQALPQLDLTFRYTINGLSSNAGRSFDQMSGSNFQDYFVGISFQYPIGNRGPRAEMTKAVLQQNQAIAALKQVIEQIILEVDVSVRGLQTSYEQVAPSKKSVAAAETWLDSVIARKTDLSPAFLDVQLQAQETLAQTRRVLLGALTNYNIALVELERAKDTLLRYDNVAIEPVRPD